MAAITREQIEAGAALYSRPFLLVYDWLALGLISRFIWKCTSSRMLEHCQANITANHLDIGVGTGYFLDKVGFPSPAPRLALMDLNDNSLGKAARRLARYHPHIYRRNALEPFGLDGGGFDSIGMMNLLHCLPGDLESKSAVFENALSVLNEGGVVFGSTIIHGGIEAGSLAERVLKMTNRRHYMTNLNDSLEGLRSALEKHFSLCSVSVCGYMAFFRAWK